MAMTLRQGSRLGPYEIVAPLGAGGMGEVYRARDPRLAREVAIKVLPASFSQDAARLRRFEQEARAAGRLNHPNIVSVYDIGSADGTPYVVLELLEGETLQSTLAGGGLTLKQALDYALQIAQGLAAAHEKGITHRDLKPGNLFVTNDGRVKILDFGLAKLTHPETPRGDRSDLPTAALETQPGAVLGTLGYMSPEQVKGAPADARSDIFSFGAVLYEMLSGRPAFLRESVAETMSAILRDEPPGLGPDGGVPPRLVEVLRHCLEKAPQQRFQSARDVAFALRAEIAGPQASATPPPAHPRASFRVTAAVGMAGLAVVATLIGLAILLRRPGGGPEVGPIHSLAVLPLTSLSSDPEQEYFADGMTDALITDLAKIGALRVVSRTSVMRYKRTQKPVAQIARELDVEGVLEGSIERSQNRVRITARLIRAATDQHLWADSYEGDLRDVLALQDQVARSVAGEIRIEVTPGDRLRLARPRAIDPAAYELYLKGRYFWAKRTPGSIDKAIGLFHQAIDIDAANASVYVGLAECYMSLGFSFDVGSLPPTEAIPKAKAAVARAAELDDSLAELHSTLAFVKLNFDWDLPGARAEFERALELNPGSADAHHWYAHYLIAAGRQREALAESKRALELDPVSPIMGVHLGWLYYYLRQNDLALRQLGRTLELDPSYGLAHWYVGLVEEEQGRYGEGLDAIRRGEALLEGNVVVRADVAHMLAASGRRKEAEGALRDLLALRRNRYVNPFEIALIHVGLGRRDEAFRWLDRAYEDRSDLLVYLGVDPRLDPVRSDPRFETLVRRVGLPPPPAAPAPTSRSAAGRGR